MVGRVLAAAHGLQGIADVVVEVVGADACGSDINHLMREPFGVVELTCLRKLEVLLAKYAPGKEIGAPPPADIRVVPGR